MPRYELPKEKKQEVENVPPKADYDLEWRRRISVPANKAIIEAIKAGEKVKVTLEAKVIGTSFSESQDQSSGSVDLDVSAIELYPGDESPGDYIKRRRRDY